LLLSGTKGQTLKISDFGLSGITNKNQNFFSTICGTPHYVAPEVLSGRYDGKIADIWSCGIILFVMASGCHPFDGDNVNELFKRVESLEFKYPPYFSPGLRALLDKIIILDPLKRAALDDIIKDKWYNEGYAPAAVTPTPITASSPVHNGNEDAVLVDAKVEYDDNQQKQPKQNKEVELMDAFQLISYVTENTAFEKQKTCMIVIGKISEVHEEIMKFLQSSKYAVVSKDTSFEVRAII